MKKSREVGITTQPPITRDPPLNEKPDIVFTIVLSLFGLGIIYILFTGGLGRAVWFLWGILCGLASLAVRRQNLLDRSGSSIREYPVHQLS
jgi:hypothetical protein